MSSQREKMLNRIAILTREIAAKRGEVESLKEQVDKLDRSPGHIDLILTYSGHPQEDRIMIVTRSLTADNALAISTRSESSQGTMFWLEGENLDRLTDALVAFRDYVKERGS